MLSPRRTGHKPQGQTIFVTGCAGFIGSNLVDQLLGQGHRVIGFDNLSTGHRAYLKDAESSGNFEMIVGDIVDQTTLAEAMAGADFVFHMAANADIKGGLDHPGRDLEQNTIGTFNVLEAMRGNGVQGIGFASSGAVYGEPKTFPTPEQAPFPVQTSLYGASKLACEGLISAYCHGFGMQGYIFRFVSVLGERYSHGHVFDFVRKLHHDPARIEVLGDGNQRKSYLHVDDCVQGMLIAVERGKENLNIFNLGNRDYCTVNESLSWIAEHLGLDPVRHYTGGERGWVGDSPFVYLDTTRIQSLGWSPSIGIREAVLKTVGFLEQNPWLVEQVMAGRSSV